MKPRWPLSNQARYEFTCLWARIDGMKIVQYQYGGGFAKRCELTNQTCEECRLRRST